jgi:hypothetical protein
MKAAARIQVGMGNHKFPFHRLSAYQVQKEGLARSIFADNKAEACTAVGHALNILADGRDFGIPANLNVIRADARSNASA